MRKCRKCGDESNGRTICMKCLLNYTEAKVAIVDALEAIHGKMCPENLSLIQKETKRLVKVWRRDHLKLEAELINL